MQLVKGEPQNKQSSELWGGADWKAVASPKSDREKGMDSEEQCSNDTAAS